MDSALEDTPAGDDGLLDLFLRLAAIPSPSRSERAVADVLTAELRGLGLDPVEDGAAEIVGGDTGNLIVRLPGSGAGAPIVIAAHLDTVATGGRIVPVVENGVVRSAGDTILGADDKAAVAALVMTLGDLLREPPACGLVAVFSVAEEIGLLGAKALDLDGLGARAGFVFDTSGPVGDIVVRAPSQTLVEATFHGLAAHAGIAPEKGRSAIQAAARAVAALDLGRLPDSTTVNVGVISGGSATNVVPALCAVSAEVRGHDDDLLSQRVATLIETLEIAATECGVDLELSVRSAFEAFSLSVELVAVRIATAALRAAGFEPRLTASGGGSDVNVYNAKGLPSVNLSVGMEDVHSPQESMPVARLHEVQRVMRALVEVAGSVMA